MKIVICLLLPPQKHIQGLLSAVAQGPPLLSKPKIRRKWLATLHRANSTDYCFQQENLDLPFCLGSRGSSLETSCYSSFKVASRMFEHPQVWLIICFTVPNKELTDLSNSLALFLWYFSYIQTVQYTAVSSISCMHSLSPTAALLPPSFPSRPVVSIHSLEASCINRKQICQPVIINKTVYF